MKRAIGLVLLLLLVLLGGAVAAAWAPDRAVGGLTQRWAPAPSRFVDIGGLSVHLRDEGPRDDPVPIVLVHGALASLHTWEGWAATLRGERRVVSFDLPGFGLTGPSPRDDYSMAADARFVVDLLDALKIERCVLAGNSLGGEIAWHVALAAPDRVERLVLVAAGGYPYATPLLRLGFRAVRAAVVHQAVRHVLPRRGVVLALRAVYGEPSRVGDALIDRYAQLLLREGNRKALARRFGQMRPGADAASIPALNLPTLILWGGRDRLHPPAVARAFASDIAGSSLVVFEDLGHLPQEEDPARSVGELRRFLGMAPVP